MLFRSNNTANDNTAIGHHSALTNTSGTANTAVGYKALTANTTAHYNTAVGWQSMLASAGAGNYNIESRGLLCPKCSHVNPNNLKLCEYCKTRLFTKCRQCGCFAQSCLSFCNRCNYTLNETWIQKIKMGIVSRLGNILKK